MMDITHSTDSLVSSGARGKYPLYVPIKPYISSTLDDFQDERDILIQKVFPEIDKLCKLRCMHCTPVDIRIADDDPLAQNGHALRLCLETIGTCTPFFVCLLGERYGTFREENAPDLPENYDGVLDNENDDLHWIDRNYLVASSSKYDWIKQKNFRHLSFTEIEVMQACLFNESQYARFYFRQPHHVDTLFTDLSPRERDEKLAVYLPQSEIGNIKVRDLKSRIVKKGLPVKYFDSAEELADIALGDWKAIVDELYPPLLDGIPDTDVNLEDYKEWLCHETFAESRRKAFVRTPELLDLLDELTEFAGSAIEGADIEEDRIDFPHSLMSASYSSFFRRQTPIKVRYDSIALLVGDRGCGKSSAVANWVKQFSKENHEVRVVYHAVGSSYQSTDVLRMLRRFTEELQEDMPEYSDNEVIAAHQSKDKAHFHQATQAFLASLSKHPCAVVIDGLNNISGGYGFSQQQIKTFSWLPIPLPRKCKLIISTTKSDMTFKVLSKRPDVQVYDIPSLVDLESKQEVIKDALGKQEHLLNRSHMAKVLGSKLGDQAVYLCTLAEEINQFDVYKDLESYLTVFTEVNSIGELWRGIIRRWVRDYSWNSDVTGSESGRTDVNAELTGWVADVLRLIAVSRYGLSRNELMALLDQLGYTGETEVTEADWHRFILAASHFLVERPNGLYKFHHNHFQEIVEYNLLGIVTPETPVNNKYMPSSVQSDFKFLRQGLDRPTFHQHIATYFYNNPPSLRMLEELPWHLEKIGDLPKLVHVLSQPKIFACMFGNKLNTSQMQCDLVYYWKTLKKENYDPSTIYMMMYSIAADYFHIGGTPDIGRLSRMDNGGQKTEEGSVYSEGDQEVQLFLKTGKSSIPKIVMPTGDMSVRSEKSVGEMSQFSEQEIELKDPLDNDEIILRDPPTDSQETFKDTLYVANEHGWSPKDLALMAKAIGQFLFVMDYTQASMDAFKLASMKLTENFPLDLMCQMLYSQIHENVGNLNFLQDKPLEAAASYEKAMDAIADVMEELLEPRERQGLNFLKGQIQCFLGHMYTAQPTTYHKAEQMFTRAKKSMEAAGHKLWRTAVIYKEGILWLKQRQLGKANRNLQLAYRSLESTLGKLHPKVADVLVALAAAITAKEEKTDKEIEKAEELLRRALFIREQCFGRVHLEVANVLFDLGYHLKTIDSNSSRSEALVLLKRALDIRVATLGPAHYLVRDVNDVLSTFEMALNFKSRATLDPRNSQIPFSSLSLHDFDLAQLQERASSAKYGKRRNNYTHRKVRSAKELPVYQKQEVAESDNFSFTESEHNFGPNFENITAKDILTDPDIMAIMAEMHTKENVQPQDNLLVNDATISRESLKIDLRHVCVPSDETSKDNTGTTRLSTDVETSRRATDGTRESQRSDMPSSAIQRPGSGKPITRIMMKKQGPEADQYIDSFANEQGNLESVSKSALQKDNISYSKKEKRVRIRSQSAPPVKLFERLRDSAGQMRPHSSASVNKPQYYGVPGGSFVRPAINHNEHKKACYVPGSHTVDKSNTYSVMSGPHVSILSLLGPAPCPRRVSKQIHHTSAWYHVPGRYPTVTSPYPPNRSQYGETPTPPRPRSQGSSLGFGSRPTSSSWNKRAKSAGIKQIRFNGVVQAKV